MGASGSTIVDFGAGADHASVAVGGQGAIVAGSLCEAWLDPTRASTTPRTVDEHVMAAAMLGVTCSLIVAGVGFTINATGSSGRLIGQFAVSWVWN